jgi:hypothetical protein
LATCAEAAGDADGADDCTTPFEPEASFPPPACTAPVELAALLPPPEILAGTATVAVWFAAVADALASTACAPACTTPVEPVDELPPAWPAPVELEASLPPPPVETGAEALAVVVFPLVSAAGAAEIAPTWTTPVELVAVLPGSAAAVPAGPSTAALHSTARPRSLDFMKSARFLVRRHAGAQSRRPGTISIGIGLARAFEREGTRRCRHWGRPWPRAGWRSRDRKGEGEHGRRDRGGCRSGARRLAHSAGHAAARVDNHRAQFRRLGWS